MVLVLLLSLCLSVSLQAIRVIIANDSSISKCPGPTQGPPIPFRSIKLVLKRTESATGQSGLSRSEGREPGYEISSFPCCPHAGLPG